jgi:hypothetical protein
MSRSDLWMNWIVSALPLLFVLALLLVDVAESAQPWMMLVFVAAVQIKQLLLSSSEELRARYREPISRREGALMLLIVPAMIAGYYLLTHVEAVAGRYFVAAAALLVLVVLWLKDALAAWQRFKFFSASLFMLFTGLYLLTRDLFARQRMTGLWLLLVLAAQVPLTLRRQLFGPSVISISFLPAVLCYTRGFKVRIARLKNIRRVAMEAAGVVVVRRNGRTFTVSEAEFPDVPLPVLAERLNETAQSERDPLQLFRVRGIPGFEWIDPSVRQPISLKEKKIALAFGGLVVLAFAVWLLRV